MYSYKEIEKRINAFATDIVQSVHRPEEHPQWNKFKSLLDMTNEVSAFFHWKEEGKRGFEIALIGDEDDLEKELQKRRNLHPGLTRIDIETRPYWSLGDYQQLYNLISLNKIAFFAQYMHDKLKNDEFLSGPISGNPLYPSCEENAQEFFYTVLMLQKCGCNVFDQTPLIPKLSRLINDDRRPKEVVIDEILEKVFYPIIESGKLQKQHRMHNWKSSVGATKEIIVGNYAAVPSYQLPENFSKLSVEEAKVCVSQLSICNAIVSH